MRHDAQRPRRPVTLPPGTWPAEMRAAKAAAYVDELSVDAFLAKVSKGIYSRPVHRPNSQPKWLREKLDLELRTYHRLLTDGDSGPEDLSDFF